MKFLYLLAAVKVPIPSLGGGQSRPRPIIAAHVIGASGSQVIDGLLDTGSEKEWLAGLLGVDLTRTSPRDIDLVGRVQPVRVRYAPVQLRITDGLQEVHEWPAVIGFTPIKLRYPLFGYARFLQYFNTGFPW